MKSVPLIFLGICLASAGALPAETFDAIIKKRGRPDGRGQLQVAEQGIEFTAAKADNSRRWSYADIQHFDRLSETEFVLLTYEDRRWRLGRDRQIHFVLTSGAITDELFAMISARMGRPVTDRVVRDLAAGGYRLSVKHLHRFGGCQGTLLFSGDAVVFKADNPKDARVWKLSRDIESVWSAGPYHLELHVYENNRREFSRARVFKFDLKKPLDPAFYRELKLKMFRRSGGAPES